MTTLRRCGAKSIEPAKTMEMGLRVIGTCLTRCPALGIRMISSSKFSFPGDVFPQLSKVTKETGI